MQINKIRKNLGLLFPAMRISLALTMLSICILLGAEMLGFTPSEQANQLETRKRISESLAIQFSVLEPVEDISKVQKLISYIVKRNDDLLSAGVRNHSGKLIIQSGNHETLWQEYNEQESTSAHINVPLFSNGKPWGQVEFNFEPLAGDSWFGFFQQDIFKTVLFILLIGFFVYLAFMMRTLRQLDPSAVIPERVSAAFDTLSEGVIIIDEKEQILLTNKAFADRIGRPASSLMGSKASELKWKRISTQKSGLEYPWLQVLKSGKSSVGAQLILKTGGADDIKFLINASPISGEGEKPQGVLITLGDITELENRNTQLQTIVSRLKKTQNKVQQQNKELSYLATRDPLTGCLNRRSFSEQFEIQFNAAREFGSELSCIMVDLDHFKLVNDNYGHATGDEVIKMLAQVLKSNTRKDDLVGRYGGEEFCLVLPGMSADMAMTLAERIRLRIKDESTSQFDGGPRVTASLGVASIKDNPKNPGELNHQADEALYVAKESGRNRVSRWQTDADSADTAEPGTDETGISEQEDKIPAETQQVNSLQNRILELESIASQFSSELEYSKSHDELTGLPSQVLFHDRMQQAIDRGFRHDQIAAVLVIDIEMFSQINATLGRAGGDKLLKEVAGRLNSIIRKTDGVSRLTVSRFAGDEFAVLLTDISKKEQVTWGVKRLLESINETVDIDGHTVYLACHVGISLYPSDADSVDVLLNNAMTAKKYSKTHKSEFNYQFFDSHMQELSIKHLHLEKDLHHAIKNEHWQLLYQPKMDMKQGSIVGAEALIRWQHPRRGLLTPFEFIDFAESRGLIIQIGDWVIRESCRQLKAWIDLGIQNCHVAINLSSVQLVQPDIVDKILSTLERYQVPPRLFEIEITETILMENVQAAIESLKRLHASGISIAIDDFGTGYSSLSYLKNLPINRLKIDRAFIKDICQDANDQKIVQTLITMAHSMDMSVVAEGVEDRQQYDLLDRLGCDEIQGYLLSKPLAAESLQLMLESPQVHIDDINKVVQLHP